MSELEDIGNSIGNSIKDMVGLETNKDIIDDIKDIDVGHINFGAVYYYLFKSTKFESDLFYHFRMRNIV